MSPIDVRPLDEALDFGARVGGLTSAVLTDEAVRQQLRDLFEERGLIVFEGVEPSGAMQVAISQVFGPLKGHPVNAVPTVGTDAVPGLIDMHQKPFEGTIVRIAGRELMSWLPWHFDHCYNDELNLAGVLRGVVIPQDGGLTGFADGIALYRRLPAELRGRIEGRNILYSMDVSLSRLRFGRPSAFEVVKERARAEEIRQQALKYPRAIHPAVWTRPSGEKVLHISPWMAVGIEGQEDAEGQALLAQVCEVLLGAIKPYHHAWSPSDMLIWDNRRMLHCASGTHPSVERRMQRTTIRGDYGLGSFENQGRGGAILEMTV